MTDAHGNGTWSLIVLSGGRSRRMGADKARLAIGGEIFLSRILRSFPDAGQRIVSVGADVPGQSAKKARTDAAGQSAKNARTDAAGRSAESAGCGTVITVPDRIPDYGPLGGLEASLRCCTSEYVFVTACDQPLMEQRFADRLLSWMPDAFDAAVPVSRDGRIHPLSALYRTEALRNAVDAQIAEGDHRVRKLLERMRTMYVPADAIPDGARCLRNVNTPEEYAELSYYDRTPSGIPVFAIAAYSGTGKTTFLEKLIPELKRQRPGLRIGVVKHDVHGFTVDQEGKDTRRLADAGADLTAILNDAHAAVMEHRPRSVYEILEGLSELDLIFLEGFKKEPFRKILLYRKEAGQPPAADPAECFLVIADPAECFLVIADPAECFQGNAGDGSAFHADFSPDETEKIAAALLKKV